MTTTMTVTMTMKNDDNFEDENDDSGDDNYDNDVDDEHDNNDDDGDNDKHDNDRRNDVDGECSDNEGYKVDSDTEDGDHKEKKYIYIIILSITYHNDRGKFSGIFSPPLVLRYSNSLSCGSCNVLWALKWYSILLRCFRLKGHLMTTDERYQLKHRPLT